MDIERLDIQHFAKEEYQNLVVPDIDGQDTLIYGNNRTGKTLTLNAILYNLLGSKETIDLATGRGNQVEIGYSDGITFYRGVPEAEFKDGSDHLTAEQAQSAFSGHLSEVLSRDITQNNLIKSHFLHSRIEQLPLNSLSASNRLALIRTVVNQDSQDRLEKHQRAEAEIEQLITDLKLKLSEIEEDRKDLKNEANSAKNQLQKWERLKEMAESGRLSQINQKLAEDESIRNELSNVYKEQEGLRKELRTLNKQKREWQRYHESEVIQVIANAVEDFVCPVCADHIPSEKAENRAGQGYCPFCGQERDLRELKEEIREQISVSTGQLEEIEEREDEISERQEELDTREKELKSGRPTIDELDSFTERRLRENDYEVEGLLEKAEEEYELNRETLEENSGEIEELDGIISNLRSSLETYEESIAIVEDSVEEIRRSSIDLIQQFVEAWKLNHEELTSELSLNIGVSEEGKIVIPGNTGDRTLDQDGDLSAAEVRLLNTSFAVTINEFATDSGLTHWKTLVLDEPFANLDETGQDDLLSFIDAKPQQFIVTSSDPDRKDRFPKSVKLERNNLQSTFQDFDL